MSIFYILSRFGYNKFSRFCNDVPKCINLRQICINFTKQKFLSQKLHDTYSPSTFMSFNKVISDRKLQANRSILVQVQSAQSCQELYTYCSTIGTVKHMFHYSMGLEPLHFIIVEFSNEIDVSNILSRSTHVNDTQIVPAFSLFLWFKPPIKKLKQRISKAAKLDIENGVHIPSETEIKQSLRNEENISNQMNLLYNTTKLNEVGIRLRFLIARQIESALSGIFPNMIAYPFGSSVNGFGKMGCDLDLVLRLNENHTIFEDSRLVFHCKPVTGSERSTSQRQMETIGDILHLFLPGCSQVRRILQARVPIIKYHQQFADVECDLSMLNMSGVHMSDLLYIMGEFDSRVRPLVFTIRKWACEVGLSNSSPGRWITNFSLTLMVLAFLQKPNRRPPILPGLNLLIKSAGPQDTFITEDGINCTFLRELSKLNFATKNTDTLQSLLEQFFEYYSQFDFSNRAICLNDGSPITKPDHSPLYIVNPLERCLNVSKNVSMEELEKMKAEMRNAAWLLESQDVKTLDWGILSLFNSKKKYTMPPSKQSKLLEVSELFDEEQNLAMHFKNDRMEEEVTSIRKETKRNIKQLEAKLKKGKSRR